jgi:hypothetical protein
MILVAVRVAGALVLRAVDRKRCPPRQTTALQRIQPTGALRSLEADNSSLPDACITLAALD